MKCIISYTWINLVFSLLALARQDDHPSASLGFPEAAVNITRTKMSNSSVSTPLGLKQQGITGMDSPPQKYKAIVMVLASHQTLWEMMKPIWMQYMDREPSIKVIFVYAQDPTDVDPGHHVLNGNDLHLSGVPERYPIYIDKTLEAFKFVDEKFDYDFLVRTNLSTFWILDRLLEYLGGLPTENYYGGFKYLMWSFLTKGDKSFAAGWEVVMSRDVVTSTIAHSAEATENYVNHSTPPEDMALGAVIVKEVGVPFVDTSERSMRIESAVNSSGLNLVNNIVENAWDDGRIMAIRIKIKDNKRDCTELPIRDAFLKKFYGVGVPPDLEERLRYCIDKMMKRERMVSP